LGKHRLLQNVPGGETNHADKRAAIVALPLQATPRRSETSGGVYAGCNIARDDARRPGHLLTAAPPKIFCRFKVQAHDHDGRSPSLNDKGTILSFKRFFYSGRYLGQGQRFS
jgi:hypothetical protein